MHLLSVPAWSSRVRDLGDRIADLSMREAAELSHYLRSVHRIEAPPTPVRVVEPDPIPPPPVVSAEASLRLEGHDPARKLMLIKLLREIFPALGLREAKELVEAGQRVITPALPRAEAERIQKQLETVGARVTLIS